MSNFLERLQQQVDAEWAKIRRGAFFSHAERHFDRDLFILVMKQIFHYTKFNSMNQAAAAYGTQYGRTKLLAFGMKHALEELGHERMIIRDLATIGVSEEEIVNSKPLPATEALNGYLFSVGLRQGMVPRLGYSFWAESSYDQINGLIQSAKRSLDLSDDQLTFFVAHSSIDEKHAAEVEQAISDFVSSPEEEEALLQVARTTLYMTGQILEACLVEVGVREPA